MDTLLCHMALAGLSFEAVLASLIVLVLQCDTNIYSTSWDLCISHEDHCRGLLREAFGWKERSCVRGERQYNTSSLYHMCVTSLQVYDYPDKLCFWIIMKPEFCTSSGGCDTFTFDCVFNELHE